MSARHHWERSAFTLIDVVTGTAALVRRTRSGWIWAVVDGYGRSGGKGEADNESIAKGDAGKAFDATVKAWKP